MNKYRGCVCLIKTKIVMLDFEAADIVESNVCLLSALIFCYLPLYQAWCRKSVVKLKSSYVDKYRLGL